jgi:hypothetical protein
MKGIGKDNWLKYHFEGSPTREDNVSNFSMSFDTRPTLFIEFKKVCSLVAEEIYELNKNKKIFIAMSGGCDSEIVANSFYNLGIPFTPIIHEFYYLGLESTYADTWWAKKWCKERNITPIIRQITYPELFSEIKPIAEKIKARKIFSIQNVVLANYVKEQGGILINGQAFLEYYPEPTLEYLKDIIHDPRFYKEGSLQSGWLLHEDDLYVELNDPGYHPYNFLSWNREIVLSYIKSRDMSLNSEENKFIIMGCSPRPKLAAPEVAWVFLREYQDKLKRKYGSSEVFFFGTHTEIIKKLEG